jgi:hypothetical protein
MSKLSIPDALRWSFERNLPAPSLDKELTSDKDAKAVVASAASVICCRNGEHETPEQYRRLKVEVRAMLAKVHTAWLKERRAGKA